MLSIVVFASDLSMLKNEWGLSQYPFVSGHEVIGRVSAIGNMVNHLKVGQYVGLGWRARSCLVCDQCLSGHHNRCLKGEDVIIGRHGAYRHSLEPIIEEFPFSRVNEALAHLESGKARYRIVLRNDFN
jgi:D-arabinose 1-dehydrogenase-like Zn-dependent alcohol dehydrogenase